MESLRDVKRVMEREIKKGSSPIVFDRIDFAFHCPPPVSSLTEDSSTLHQKIFQTFFCCRYGLGNGLKGTSFHCRDLLICKVTEIVQHEPTALFFRQLTDCLAATGFLFSLSFLS